MSAALQEISRHASTVNQLKLDHLGIKAAIIHGHTNLGDGVLTPQEAVDKVANRGIDALILTEHRSRTPGDIAIAYAQDTYPWLEMYGGQEVETNEGHILFIARSGDKGKEIPSDKPIIDSAWEIRDRGGLFIVAHPGNKLVQSVQKETFYKLHDADLSPDATERVTTYRWPPLIGRNYSAELTEELDEKMLGADVVGSDFHGREPIKGVVVYQSPTVFGAIQEKKTKGIILTTHLPEGRTIRENYQHYKDCVIDSLEEAWRRMIRSGRKEVVIFDPSEDIRRVA